MNDQEILDLCNERAGKVLSMVKGLHPGLALTVLAGSLAAYARAQDVAIDQAIAIVRSAAEGLE